MSNSAKRPDRERAADSSQPPHGGSTGRRTPESAQQALAEARDHADAATREALAAVASLLDAIALASTGEPAETHRLLAPAADVIQRLRTSRDVRASATLLEAVADALDGEISRWERRAIDDTEARSVLRAFLGLRELLWEFGVRRTTDDEAPDRTSRAPQPTRPRKSRGKPVRHVPVEG